jgi:hypothetical protein
MPGSGYSPLQIKSENGESSELDQFVQAAHESPPLDEVIALTGVDAGLRGDEIAHFVEDWLDKTGEDVCIDVPQSQRCRLGTGDSGRGGDTRARSAPCHNCKNRNVDQDWLRAKQKLPDHGNCFRPKSEAAYKGRKIPIRNEKTERVVLNYFTVHDIIGTRTAVRDAVIRVAKRAGIYQSETVVNDDGKEITHHWPTTHDLRDTFGTRLAIKEFTANEIKSAMGHEKITTADDYVELSGAATVSAFEDKW